MAQEIAGHALSSALIFDDQKDARDAYAETLEDAGLEPLPEAGPVGALEDCLGRAQQSASAALCDHFLHHRNYAQFEGAQLVKLLYDHKVPAVLCTTYDELIDDIRPFRRWIPSLQRPAEMDGDRFLQGVQDCFFEFSDRFHAHRQPWRTQIKVIDVRRDEKRFFIEIPAWGPTVVPLKFYGIPDAITDALTEEWRCRAYVNLGAQDLTDLYVCDWELPE